MERQQLHERVADAKRNIRGAMCLVFCICMVFTLLHTGKPVQADALEWGGVTFAELNDDSVFLKQTQARVCTLTASAMMIRRAAMLSGDEDWAEITESSVRKSAWVEGAGLKWNFSSAGITVSHKSLSSNKELISMLEKHPEGVVIYNSSKPHAILVTDYTDGIFYCSDPSNAAPEGRYPVEKASISVESASRCWYVKTPTGLELAPDNTLGRDILYDAGNLKYKIESADEKTAVCVGIVSESTSVRIPASVKINGASYRVVKVEERAFAGNTTVTAVRIGSNVVAVEKEAFYNCTRLKKVIIDSNRLRKVGEKAFSGIYKKAQILVAEGQVEEYTTLFSSSAIPKTAVVKSGA